MRCCDLAGAKIQVLSKEKFGFGPWNQPVTERDKALEKASAWMESRGTTHLMGCKATGAGRPGSISTLRMKISAPSDWIWILPEADDKP